ncbi:MAG: EVE domain-containing protein [Candidatus Zixiibacteriota bacterium]|nr:MAG: EVE domain-containing protein [candidate division Zixibacteria bacterium]
MPKRYWLFKNEPDCFSIDDLENTSRQTTGWEGVRNYQARNFLRDEVKEGDEVLFYHSNANPPGVVGICRVVRGGYPDPTALDPRSKYYDPRSTKDKPRWYMVDIKLTNRLVDIIPLSTLKKTPGLENMMVTQKGSRLSIQPVTPGEWRTILRLIRQMQNRFGRRALSAW